MTANPAGANRSIWFMRIRHADTAPPEESLVGVASDEYPDGAVVDLATHGAWPLGPDRLVRVRYLVGSTALISVKVSAAAAGSAPPLRYVEAAQQESNPPAHVLVAFLADSASVGRVDDTSLFHTLGLDGADQVAAIRWYPHTGLIHQVYVAPAHRRTRIGTAMILAAAGVRASRGWPSLRADGRRTEDGEAFRMAGPSEWAHRVEELTETMPPMTPPGRPSDQR